MRTRLTRLPPLTDEQIAQKDSDVLKPFRAGGGMLPNVVRTFMHHPRSLAAFRVWATYVMIDKNDLPEREREIVAMRTAWRIRCPYVWSRHISYAVNAGLSEEEMEGLKRPIEDRDWKDSDIALIRMTDALVDTFFIPDDIWESLTSHFNDVEVMDAIFVCGHFCLMGMFLNAAGTPLDGDVSVDHDFDMVS